MYWNLISENPNINMDNVNNNFKNISYYLNLNLTEYFYRNKFWKTIFRNQNMIFDIIQRYSEYNLLLHLIGLVFQQIKI